MRRRQRPCFKDEIQLMGVEYMGGLLTAIVTAIPIGLWVVAVLGWMIQGELDSISGVISIGVALALLFIAIASNSPAIAGLVLVVSIASMALFPFAYSQLEKRLHKELDEEQLEKAHAAFASHPDNINARFQIAKILHKYGLVGHAIAIGDEAARHISGEMDPLQNRSQRDFFHSELYQLKSWKQQVAGQSVFRPVACTRCGQMNQPGTIACCGCRAPFLLDLARQSNVKSRFIKQLVVAWAVIAAVIVVAPYAAMMLQGFAVTAALVGIIGLAGAVLFWTFREKPLGA